jgi:hypothetical protein
MSGDDYPPGLNRASIVSPAIAAGEELSGRSQFSMILRADYQVI